MVRGATADSIILVGGGDPTLAVNPFRGSYPHPATLSSLAASTARALIAQGTVRFPGLRHLAVHQPGPGARLAGQLYLLR